MLQYKIANRIILSVRIGGNFLNEHFPSVDAICTNVVLHYSILVHSVTIPVSVNDHHIVNLFAAEFLTY
jgi:hypothetical protein